MMRVSYCVGADITDYFNYGFTEDTWKQYCEKQRRLRMDLNMPKKTFVVRAYFHRVIFSQAMKYFLSSCSSSNPQSYIILYLYTSGMNFLSCFHVAFPQASP